MQDEYLVKQLVINLYVHRRTLILAKIVGFVAFVLFCIFLLIATKTLVFTHVSLPAQAFFTFSASFAAAINALVAYSAEKEVEGKIKEIVKENPGLIPLLQQKLQTDEDQKFARFALNWLQKRSLADLQTTTEGPVSI